MALRPADFLPNPKFSGQDVSHEKAISHWYLFVDYLQVHELYPVPEDQMDLVTVRFRLTLCGEARLWAQDKIFEDLNELKTAFIHRFSPTHSEYANVQYFDDLKYKSGETAEQFLQKIRIAAQRIRYNEPQIRNKFLHSLPAECKRAVVMTADPDADAEDLASLAQRYLDLLPGHDLSRVSFGDEVHTAIASSSVSTINEFKTLRDDIKSLEDGMEKLQAQFAGDSTDQDRSRSPGPNRSSRGRFKRTGGNRHRSKSPAPRTPSGERMKCYHCGKQGHVRRRCFLYHEYLQMLNSPEARDQQSPRCRPPSPWQHQNHQGRGQYQPQYQTYQDQPYRGNYQRNLQYPPQTGQSYQDRQPDDQYFLQGATQRDQMDCPKYQ